MNMGLIWAHFPPSLVSWKAKYSHLKIEKTQQWGYQTCRSAKTYYNNSSLSKINATILLCCVWDTFVQLSQFVYFEQRRTSHCDVSLCTYSRYFSVSYLLKKPCYLIPRKHEEKQVTQRHGGRGGGSIGLPHHYFQKYSTNWHETWYVW